MRSGASLDRPGSTPCHIPSEGYNQARHFLTKEEMKNFLEGT